MRFKNIEIRMQRPEGHDTGRTTDVELGLHFNLVGPPDQVQRLTDILHRSPGLPGDAFWDELDKQLRESARTADAPHSTCAEITSFLDKAYGVRAWMCTGRCPKPEGLDAEG